MSSTCGGKISADQKFAVTALSHLKPFVPAMKGGWTHDAPLPGGNLPNGDREAWCAELSRRYPALPYELLRALSRRHGTRAVTVLGDARTVDDLGEDFGADLTEREIVYLRDEEWALTTEDVLWRRTKCGLPMTVSPRARVDTYLASRPSNGSSGRSRGE